MMGVIVSLYVLVMMDSAFSGICAASGRNAVLNKRAYYLRSMWDGAMWGNVACVVGVVLLLLAVWFSTDRERTTQELVAVGRRMSHVYWIYSVVVLSTFLVRAIPSVDIRAITSTIGFGPLTLIRPAVVLAGIVWGLMTNPGPNVVIVALGIATMMMSFRVFLDHRFGKMKRYVPAFRHATAR